MMLNDKFYDVINQWHMYGIINIYGRRKIDRRKLINIFTIEKSISLYTSILLIYVSAKVLKIGVVSLEIACKYQKLLPNDIAILSK